MQLALALRPLQGHMTRCEFSWISFCESKVAELIEAQALQRMKALHPLYALT